VSKKKKRYQRILDEDSPVPNDVTPQELRSCLLGIPGVTERTGKGDHHVFCFPKKGGGQISFPVPMKLGQDIRFVYILKIREIVAENELI
jgi:predicted DNA-binding transcriptional regulator AlpA